MREIKFRGKRIDNGEWVYGTFYSDFSTNPLATHYIVDEFGTHFEIDRTTVSQYTGLRDKNGKGIYEFYLIKQQDYKEPLEIYFCDDCAGFRARLKGYGNTELIKDDCEIIGNIYENPELLK